MRVIAKHMYGLSVDRSLQGTPNTGSGNPYGVPEDTRLGITDMKVQGDDDAEMHHSM